MVMEDVRIPSIQDNARKALNLSQNWDGEVR